MYICVMENKMKGTYQGIIERRDESTRVYQLIDDLINESGFNTEMITEFCKRSIEFNEIAIKDYREKMLKEDFKHKFLSKCP